MQQDSRFVGLDVHAETIAVAVAEGDGTVRGLGTIPNTPEAVRRLVTKLGPRERLRVCYEAGPTGYVVHRQLTALKVHCEVIAPTLVPGKAGDRVKTDRRDAEKLARSYRSGDLTAVWVPDAAHEALRDLVRAREAAKQDQLRARHRLSKFLLRHGCRAPAGLKAWGAKHSAWLLTMRFGAPAQEATLVDYRHEVDHATARIARLERALTAVVAAAPAPQRAVIAALQALRGIAALGAVTIVTEVGQLSRFAHAGELMGYSGAVPSERSSGPKTRRGAITKTGNAHLRRILMEAAHAYRHRPAVGHTLRVRQRGLSEDTKAIAWTAQHRLHARYRHLSGKGKPIPKVITAVGRELLGFVWAIGVQVEQDQASRAA